MSDFVTNIKQRLNPFKPHVLRAEALRFPVFGLILLTLAGYVLTGKPGNQETNVMYIHSQVQLLFLAAVNLIAVAITVVIARRLFEHHMKHSALNKGSDYQLSPWPMWLYVLCSLGAMLTPVAALSFSVEQGGLRAVFGQTKSAVLQPSSTDSIEQVHGTPDEEAAQTAKTQAREKLSEPEPLDGYTMIFVSLLSTCLGVMGGWIVLWVLEWLTVRSRRWLNRGLVKGYYFPFSRSISGQSSTKAASRSGNVDRQLLIYLLFLITFIWTVFDSWLLSPASSVASLIVLVILVVTMGLSGLSDLLSSWRISVVFVFLLWIGAAKIATSPHRDQLQPIAQDEPQTKVALRTEPISPPMESGVTYVVTCPGGGIHASAWSYLILSELHQHERFRKNVRFISAISGGSVGAAFYLKDTLANSAADDAEDSNSELPGRTIPNGGLDQIGRGLLHGDIRKVVLPFRLLPFGELQKGRGERLEDYFEQYLEGARMDQWEALARNRQMPVVCFGAMDILSGKRAVLHTGMEFREDTLALQIKDLLGPNKTIRVSSAIRASAAFPYVSPLVGATPDSNESKAKQKEVSRYALGDGGYIDNEGIISAIEWITKFRASLQPQSAQTDSQSDDSGSEEQKSLQGEADDEPTAEEPTAASAPDANEVESSTPAHTIYLIRIQPYQPKQQTPVSSSGDKGKDDRRRRPQKFDFGESLRWIAGPLQGLASMRTASQLERGNLEVAQLAEALNGTASGSNVVIKVVNVPFTCDDERFEPPLSWVLTPRQAQQYAPAWEKYHSSVLAKLGLDQSTADAAQSDNEDTKSNDEDTKSNDASTESNSEAGLQRTQ